VITQERLINKLQTIADRVYDEYGSIIFQRRGSTLRLERHSSDWSFDGVRFDDITVVPNALILQSKTDMPTCVWL
jgi:hypothetical protein